MDAQSSKQTQYLLQYLRAVAAAVVVFHHVAFQVATSTNAAFFLKESPGLAELGAAGVDIFFVISGFIIYYTMSEAAGPVRAGTFAWHRFVRVVPLYWFWSSILLLGIASGVALSGTRLDAAWVAASYALVPYEHAPGQFHPILDQGWTLSFELYFYVVATALIAVLPMRRRLIGLGLAMVAIQLLALALPLPVALRQWLASPLVYEFLAGAGIAHLVRFGLVPANLANHRTGLVLITLGGLGFVVSLPFADLPRILIWGVPAALLVLGAVLANREARSLTKRVFFALGTASYSLYLTHTLFAITLGGLLKRGWFQFVEPNLLIVGTTLLIVVAGSLGYWIVERPLLALFRRKRRPPYVADPTIAVAER